MEAMNVAFENRYSFFDRTLHRLAFLTTPAQTVLSDLEDKLFKAELASIELKSPVFVTALPRAGTTLLLELFVSQDEFSSHSYRDMPFIMTPMLWDKYSSRFRKTDQPRERAHGDGMMVNVDSPEAFEEVVWKSFWPEHYRKDRIIPWKNAADAEFCEFLLNHFKKIVALRSNNKDANVRYISKNNLNISRIDLLTSIFPDSLILVPFRDPLQHAASLLRQHMNFLDIHKTDRFASYYMRMIGHYDFGDNLKPVDFNGWMQSADNLDASGLAFWLEYWHAAYNYLASRSDRIHLFSYEAFCRQPEKSLGVVGNIASVHDMPGFVAHHKRIEEKVPHAIEKTSIPPVTLDKVMQLHEHLNALSFL